MPVNTDLANPATNMELNTSEVDFKLEQLKLKACLVCRASGSPVRPSVSGSLALLLTILVHTSKSIQSNLLELRPCTAWKSPSMAPLYERRTFN